MDSGSQKHSGKDQELGKSQEGRHKQSHLNSLMLCVWVGGEGVV